MNEVPRMLAVLKEHFQLPGFRNNQLQAINATLQGVDSIVILPTGAGKSLTFQFPPHMRDPAFTVVISPLLALMKDQMEKCLDRGVEAVMFNSDCSEEQKCKIVSELAASEGPCFKLLYTTPESLRQPRLRDALKEAYLQGSLLSFAIDEAHCVSEWGHDFRPAYLELATLRADFPSTPIAALTASCTAAVQRSVREVLQLRTPQVIKASFNRPNMRYVVRSKELLAATSAQGGAEGRSSSSSGSGNQAEDELVLADLVAWMEARPGECGIIYARLRATCDWLGRELSNLDIEVGVYHAGKDSMQRARVQREWSEGSISVVVATVAFGMGVDRADVRWVVHWNAPASMEGYYQESGRAGRDSLPCTALLYGSAADLESARRMERGTRAGAVAAVADFVTSARCRRKAILAFFGEARGPCGAVAGEELCDYCQSPAAVRASLTALGRLEEKKSVAAAIRARQK